MSCLKTFLEEAVEGEADADEVEDEGGRIPDNRVSLWPMVLWPINLWPM